MAITSIRAALAADADLGAGNVLHKLIEHGAPLDGPGITFDVDIDGLPAWQGLTLGKLYERVAARAGVAARARASARVTRSRSTSAPRPTASCTSWR